MDGQRLAAAGDSGVNIWEVETGRDLLALCMGSKFTDVAFSPDGKRLATTNGQNIVQLWDSTTGEELQSLRGPYAFRPGLAFSPDGNRLAAAGPGIVKVWDARPLPAKPVAQEASGDR
jgi:WD40 repeat protein